jgi:3-keto-5-aminohexanoate cleavage enzyme
MIDRLLDKNLVKHPQLVNLALGFPGTLPAMAENIMFMVKQLPQNTVWTLTPHHAADYGLHALSVALGGNVRVGFEDSIYLAPGRKASNNVELVAKARELIEQLDRSVANPAETRQTYGISTEKPKG